MTTLWSFLALAGAAWKAIVRGAVDGTQPPAARAARPARQLRVASRLSTRRDAARLAAAGI